MPNTPGQYSTEYADCLAYIDSYWDQVIHQPTRKTIQHHIVDIPYAYITPNHKKFDYIFYWDSFFMFRGLMDTKRSWIMKEMIHNFAYIFDRYGIIPNFNAFSAMNRSQPPFFSSMIIDAYFSMVPYHQHKSEVRKQLHDLHYYQEKRWLNKMISTAKQEYLTVWIDTDNAYNHHVKDSLLSRYGDRDIGYSHSAELESGWDFTKRFFNRCADFLPVDLNSLLYKYEVDFAFTAKVLDNQKDRRFWKIRAEERAQEMNEKMWDDKKGFYFDYDYQNNELSNFYSLAGFFPLWAGIASKEQAERMVKHLSKFETEYGLAATDKASLPPHIDLSQLPKRYHEAVESLLTPQQWDYPNIWAPLEYITIIGLIRYGFIDEAKRLMEKSVKAQSGIFRKYGTFVEKIDGTTGDRSGTFHYELQPGFGWTNGVFYRFIKILDELAAGNPLIEKETGETPPFSLTIVH